MFLLACAVCAAAGVSGALRLARGRVNAGGLPEAGSWATAQSGDVLHLRIKDLIPTQGAVGKDQIYYHLGRKQPNKDRFERDTAEYKEYMENERKRGDDYCEDMGRGGIFRPGWTPGRLNISDRGTFGCLELPPTLGSPSAAGLRTAVIGPGGKVYLTDGHHTMNSLVTLADGGLELPVSVRITDNWRDAATLEEFYERMQSKLYVWLRDAEDRPIAPSDLPKAFGLSHFGNDHYRTAVRLTKGLAYGTPGMPAFVEFKWGSWLRRNGVDTSAYNLTDLTRARFDLRDGKLVPRDGDSTTSYVALVRDIAIRIAGAADGEIIDDGQNASTLGRLPYPTDAEDWNDKFEVQIWRSDMRKDGRPRKGGRSWYAAMYLRCGGAADTQPACWHGSRRADGRGTD